jgi:hypothetical protein
MQWMRDLRSGIGVRFDADVAGQPLTGRSLHKFQRLDRALATQAADRSADHPIGG